MTLRFTKMHGLGNDYVYVSTFDQTVAEAAAPELARRISDRHRGVGSDGLILVAPPTSCEADVRMIMFNSDGSRAQMCGNGVRCVAKLAWDRGLARSNPMRVETDRGVLRLELTLDATGLVASARVAMGAPLLAPVEIPTLLPGPRVIDAPLPVGDRVLHATCVSMGNPHAVFYVPSLDAVPLRELGPQIEHHPAFPQRVNAHFVQVLTHDHVRMATWERGAGATQACGTGAAAVCVAGVLSDRTGRRITADLPGGSLLLEWDEASDEVFKTGPAEEICTGEWPLDR